MEFTFKDLKLTEYEKFWLNKINSRNYQYLKDSADVKEFKKNINKAIKDFKSNGFESSKINKALLYENHITLVGLWHVEPQNEVFENIYSIVDFVKQKINEKYQFNTKNSSNINVEALSNYLNISENKIKYTLFLLKNLGNFIDSKEDLRDYTSIDIDKSYIIEAYLNFNSLDELMENFFVNNNAVKNEPFDVLFQFIIDIIKTISKKESIYLAFIGGAIWFGLYLILNKIPFPNDLSNISLIGVALGLLIFLLLLFAFVSMLYYPLYNFLIDDELRNKSIKEDSFLRKYFINTEIALIISLLLFYLYYFNLNFINNCLGFSTFPLIFLIITFVIYPMFKNYFLPKIFFKKINTWKKPWWINIPIFFTDGVFFLIILLIVIKTFGISLNRNHIQLDTAVFSLQGLWFFLYSALFTFIVTTMNIFLGKYIIDKRKKGNKELYSEPLKTMFTGIIGSIAIIYILVALKAFNINTFLDNTFKYTHIGSYYSTFVIKKNYFEKIKQKEFINLISLNELNCKFEQKDYESHASCNFKIIGKNKNYYFAEYMYRKQDAKKIRYFPLNISKIKIINKNSVLNKDLLMIFNKKKFKNYLQVLKVKKETQSQLERSIINTSFSYYFINGNSNSVLCKFYVLLNLGSNYVIRIKNIDSYMNNSKKPPKYSILTIPKKYVLGTKLYN
ncbi:MAG: hypothetical protein ACYDDB_02935 [bacterium]